jgi:hypothetical protein
MDSGSQRPVASLQRSPAGQPEPVHPGAQTPPSAQMEDGGAQSKSMRHPFIAMHRPVAASQTVLPPQTIGLPATLQPGMQC